MFKRMRIFIILFALIGSGCATMIRGTEEPLNITSEPPGALAEVSDGQKCTTPGTVKLKRNQSVMIRYTKEGYEPESLSVFPTLAGAGVILGGVIDYGTGAVYNLTPNPAHVILKPAKKAEEPVQAAQPQAQPKSRIDQLADLDQLKAQGKVSAQEYKTLRQQIINGQ